MVGGSSNAEDFIAQHESELDTGGRRGFKSGRGGKGGGRGGKSGGRAGQSRDVAISKALSKLLRHDAIEAGLKLDDEGFANVEHVLKWPRVKSLQTNLPELRIIVAENAKQRFSLKPNPSLSAPPSPTSEDPSDWVIRANQGHSIAGIEAASIYTPITVAAGNIPEIVVHGTYWKFYELIVESGGLKKMSRNEIHFSTGLPEDKEGVISGMRKDAEVLIYVDVEKSLGDGVLWWLSENGVVLTEGNENHMVSTKYWKRVVGRNIGSRKDEVDLGTLWEDGVCVKELPNGHRGKGVKKLKVARRGDSKNKLRDGGKGKTPSGRGKGKGKAMNELDGDGGEGELGSSEP